MQIFTTVHIMNTDIMSVADLRYEDLEGLRSWGLVKSLLHLSEYSFIDCTQVENDF